MRERMDARFLEAIAGRSAAYQERAMVARTAAVVGASYGPVFLAKSNRDGLGAARSDDEREAWTFGFDWASAKEES